MDRILQRKLLHLSTHQYLHEVNQTLWKLLRVLRNILRRAPIHCIVEQACNALSVLHTIGQLSLNRDRLKVGADFVEDERHVCARHRHYHDRSRWLEIKERQTGTCFPELASTIIQDILRGCYLDILKTEHGNLLWLKRVG